MRVWLDMANSPHPVLLAPVASALAERGHELVVTGRDHAQTKDLTLATWPSAYIAGRESPTGYHDKARAVGRRIRSLWRYVEGKPIDVAVSLNSYAQIVAARLRRIPTVTLMDYEYQPANHVAFRLADRVAVPTVFPDRRLRVYGAAGTRVRRFDGFKEEIYLASPASANLAPPPPRRSGALRVIFRPPAHGALYHRGANAAFDAALRVAGRRDDLEALVLPRLDHQRELYAGWTGIDIMARTVDGLATLRSADIFVGAGGTMSREAALLGLRAYTMFAGRRPAVDEALIRSGHLRELTGGMSERIDWSERSAEARESDESQLRRRGAALRRWLVELVEASGAHHRRPEAT